MTKGRLITFSHYDDGESSEVKKKKKDIWLYDGDPEQADLIAGETTQTEGGYVMVIELTNGMTRLAATRHPGKYVTGWQQFVKRYRLPEIARLIVSRPQLRYEAIKRGIARTIVDHRDEEFDAYRVTPDTVLCNAETVMDLLAAP